jgi:outer membrane receptor protein involved in Fe transport
MTSFRYLTATALASATLALGHTPVSAQTSAEPAQKAESEDATTSVITVTGSRIARPNLESTVPITTVSGEKFFEQGGVSLGDILNDLPTVRSTFSQQNSSRFLGTAGLNLIDLYGLGTQRTLVVVNGRRHVGADVLSNAVSVDINTIPTDLVERVDLMTGGSSAVYGSDAIAGAVNFVLKRRFDGLQLRAQSGISKYGDANNNFISLTGGLTFGEDRGHVILNAEYTHQSRVLGSQRDNLRQTSGFVVVDTDPGSAPSDSAVDRIFAVDTRAVTFSAAGVLQFSPTAAIGAPCGRDPIGNAYRCIYQFTGTGGLTPNTGTRIGLAPNGNFIGGNGDNGREDSQLGVLPKLDRYSVNLLGDYEFSEAARAFIEAKYVRTDSLSFGSSAFFQGSTIGGGVDLRERPRFDNPFLTDATRAQINAARAQSGLAPITNGATRLTLFKNLNDLGGRQERATRETYRIVAGLEGDFNSDWHYEFAVNYGEFREKTDVLGNLNVQRFLLAMDATRDTQGNIVCRSKMDPAAAQIYPFANSDDYAQSQLANDVAQCVPFNPFGRQVTPAMRNYLLTDTTSSGKITQFDVSAYLKGDLSQLFELPGGPISFVLGGEYRRETNFFQAEEIVAQSLTFYNALPLFDPPSFEVREVFGEVRIPLIKDGFIKELSIDAAGRISDYKGRTGTVYAYNAGVNFAPIEDIRFRAAYSRSVRAPNLSDLYSEQSQNFAPGFSDPCSARNIGTGTSNRPKNCAAAGIPTSYDYVYVSSLEILSGGNPDLREETSDSYTVGAVIEPRFIPGFSMSVDYFDIKVDDVITAPSAQQIVNACYDAVDLNNQFCGLFTRAGASGAATGEDPYRIIEGSLQQTLLNYAKRTARGVNVDGSYIRDLEGLGKLNIRFIYTHMLERNNFENPADPQRANRILSELGDPKDAFNLSTSFTTGKVTFNSELRYLGKMVLNEYEDFFSVQGRPPQNSDYAPVRYYPSVFYQNLRASLEVSKKFNVYVGVDNIFNRQAPFGLTGTGGGSGIYDVRGRFMYVGIKANY